MDHTTSTSCAHHNHNAITAQARDKHTTSTPRSREWARVRAQAHHTPRTRAHHHHIMSTAGARAHHHHITSTSSEHCEHTTITSRAHHHHITNTTRDHDYTSSTPPCPAAYNTLRVGSRHQFRMHWVVWQPHCAQTPHPFTKH